MGELLNELNEWTRSGEDIAIATVVVLRAFHPREETG